MSGRILVVDDLSINRAILRAKLKAAFYECIMASDGTEALELARSAKPDLILLDYCLPDIDGLDVCKTLRADPATSDTPIVLISATAARPQRLAALRAGADDFLQKPLDDSFLLGRIRSLLRSSSGGRPGLAPLAPMPMAGMAEAASEFAPPARVDIICGTSADSDHQTLCADALFDTLICRQTSLSETLLQPDSAPPPDLLVVSPEVVRTHGVQAVVELQSRSVTRQSEICVILSQDQQQLGAMALDLGAREVLHLPLDVEEARLRLRAILQRKARRDAQARAVETQLDLALRDPLTGLHNRRHLAAELLRVARQLAGGQMGKCALLLVDLDHFKTVNDRFGHNTGDDVLVAVAQRMRAGLRQDDVIARFGGEEFVILLPDTGLGQARQVAQRLCRAIDHAPFLITGGKIVQQVTASIGIAVQSGQPTTPAEGFGRMMIDQADKALHSAKAGGRNRVVIGQTALA